MCVAIVLLSSVESDDSALISKVVCTVFSRDWPLGRNVSISTKFPMFHAVVLIDARIELPSLKKPVNSGGRHYSCYVLSHRLLHNVIRVAGEQRILRTSIKCTEGLNQCTRRQASTNRHKPVDNQRGVLHHGCAHRLTSFIAIAFQFYGNA